jgi:hypothetical protein
MGELARTLVVCGLISGTQPITLMGLLLVMTGNEPKRNGWAFLAGAFLVESTVLIGANLLVGGSVDSSSSTGRSLIIVKIVFGIALVLVGLRLRRPPRKPSPDVPPSLEKLRDLAPRKAFVAGLVLADYQGPFLASMALASASLSFSGRMGGLAFYTVFATGIPLCILLIATRSIETHRKLTDKTSWVLKNRRKIASWVLIVAGIALVGDGIIAWLVVNA